MTGSVASLRKLRFLRARHQPRSQHASEALEQRPVLKAK
jgi:hypothetical protein